MDRQLLWICTRIETYQPHSEIFRSQIPNNAAIQTAPSVFLGIDAGRQPKLFGYFLEVLQVIEHCPHPREGRDNRRVYLLGNQAEFSMPHHLPMELLSILFAQGMFVSG
jgi:hypothetical protein